MNRIILLGDPVAPSKIVCIGRNYVAHIEELGNEVPADMVVFNKPNSAIGQALHSTLGGEALHYEAEICFAVASGKLAAVGFGLDLTKRDLQSRLKEQRLPWERAKAFDGAALFSEFVALPGDIGALSLQLKIDDVPRQAGGVDLMIYKPAEILEQIREFITLEDGDIIMTGTPAGVGAVEARAFFQGQILADGEPWVATSWRAL